MDQLGQDRSALVDELQGDPRLGIRAEEIICLICGAALQRRYADRAVGGALASKIRRRPIIDDPTLRGRARPMSLEERLNRREVRGRRRALIGIATTYCGDLKSRVHSLC